MQLMLGQPSTGKDTIRMRRTRARTHTRRDALMHTHTQIADTTLMHIKGRLRASRAMLFI